MDTGKIFLGIALIAFSVAMVVNPASAAGCDSSCSVGRGNLHTADGISAAGSLQDASIPHTLLCQPSPGSSIWICLNIHYSNFLMPQPYER